MPAEESLCHQNLCIYMQCSASRVFGCFSFSIMVPSEEVPSPLWREPQGVAVAWPSPQRVGVQEGRLISGTCSLGLLRLHRSLVRLARNLTRVITDSCCVLWFVRNMMHYPSSLSCCLCPVIVLSQRAVTHWCPPAHRILGPSFSQELGHHRMHSVSLSIWSDWLTCHSRWLW